MPYLREDQAAIHVGVAGVALDNSAWAAFEGGDAEAQNVNTRPGGMQPAVELGGPVNRTDVTVKRLYSDQMHALLYQLDALTGKASMWASYTPLDANGNPMGDTITITGILKQTMRPNYEANTVGAQFLTLVMACNQQMSKASN